MNYSKQREEILEIIKNTKIHPTAEEIYEVIKNKNFTASRSTVYRNLSLLTELGTINKISIKNSPDRYDYVTKTHYHVICTKCNKVFDFNYNFNVEELKHEINLQTGVEINLNSIILEGICSDCKSKNL